MEQNPGQAGELREGLVRSLLEDGTIVSAEVEAAFRKVPRHRFAPEASLEKAYDRFAVITKKDEHGEAISSVSDPHIQAVMLEQAQVRPGMRVLEVGSGGYHAGLLAELVGPNGQVTSVDIDPEVVVRARRFLDEAGYQQVRVLEADAEAGVSDGAPYDRILVTAGAWDIPPAWSEQLTDDGRLIVPLRFRGVTRSVALRRDGDHLVSLSSALCGFVPVRGAGAHEERQWQLGGGRIALVVDDGTLSDPSALDGVLVGDRAEAWSGVTSGRSEPFNDLFLSFAAQLGEQFVRLRGDFDAYDSELVAPGEKLFPFGAVVDGSLAYMVVKPAADDAHVEIGARSFGPHARQAADAMVRALQVWDREQRRGPGPLYRIYPADIPVQDLPPGFTVGKRHSRIVISWPASGD